LQQQSITGRNLPTANCQLLTAFSPYQLLPNSRFLFYLTAHKEIFVEIIALGIQLLSIKFHEINCQTFPGCPDGCGYHICPWLFFLVQTQVQKEPSC
jgi:hypothetical protein